MTIEKAALRDADEMGRLYDAVNDHLERTINYPGWKRDVYPVRADALREIGEGTFYAARIDGRIVGSVVLSHREEKGYALADWGISLAPEQAIVIHTLCVHPDALRCGVGRALMAFAVAFARERGMRALRLDVNEKNTPAIALYERFGFCYIDTVDLGYGIEEAEWYRLYQLLL